MTGPEAAQGLARGIHVAATMSIFGSALFQTLVAPPHLVPGSTVPMLGRRLAALGWSSLALALLAALAWLGFQAAAFADGDSVGDILAAVPLILFDTHFGPLIAARFVLLVPACLILGGVIPRKAATFALASALGAGAIELQVLLGHGMAWQGDARGLLIGSEVLHILAAGTWLGGLVPLMLLVAGSAPADSIVAVRRFSRLGIACVTALAVTSLIQAWVLIGGLPGLIGTDYGRLASAKLLLFIGLLLLAALNRFFLRPRLSGSGGIAARRSLAGSILSETVFGFLVVLLAGMLLMLAPAIRQQPNWPLAWALNPSALWQSGPLLVRAHPTSFYHSPTGFTAASIVHGGKLFTENCAGCHTALQTAETGDDRSDGDLFWLLRHGADGDGGMPGLGDKLSPDDTWTIIDFLKARAIAQPGRDMRPPLAPDIPVVANGRTMPLTHLRGQIVRLVAAAKDDKLTQVPGALSLRIDPETDGWTAYATIAGTSASDLQHFAFLIDGAGRLRGVFPPRQEGTTDDDAFITALTEMR